MIIETRINELLSRWEAAGGRPSAEELCADCPELLSRLRDCISRLQSSDRHLDPADREVRPPVIPGYEISGMIGRGGMGIVWRAQQLSTKRTVALKIISAGEFASPRAKARFEREIELASRLSHPNIAHVYESDTHAGLLYYAMKLVDGVQLDQYVQANSLSRRQILELMLPICAAVQHAHQFGVIHRDLKPSNILVDAAGQPHLLDFGLAKELLTSSPQITLEEAPGTPAYMSPEQAAGKIKLVGTGSDIYTLGVILYLLVLKRFPRDVEGTAIEVMQRITMEDPVRPRVVDPTIPRDLEAMMLKLLAQSPDERYPSADALAADIRAWLDGRPIAPLRTNRRYVLRKLLVRHRYKLLAGAGVAGLILAIATYSYVSVARARNRAQTEAQISAAVNTFLLDMLASADPEESGNPVPTLPQLLDRAAARIDGSFPDQPLVEAAIRTTIGRTYVLLAFAEKGESHLRRAHELRTAALGWDHPDTLDTVGWLAQALYNDDRHVEAENILRPAIEAARRNPGIEDQRTLNLLDHLAAALYYQWRREETAQLAEEIYQTNLRIHGADDPRTVDASEDLVTAWTSVGRNAEAASLIRGALARHLASEKPQLSKLIHTYLKLGAVLAAQHKLAEAEDAYTKCVEARMALYGPNHNMVAYAKLQLGRIKERLGKGEEAETLVREAIDIDGFERPDSAAALVDYMAAARIYQNHNKPQLATEMLDKARRIAEAKLSESSSPDPWCMQAYGTGLLDLELYAQADDYLTRAIAHAQRIVSPEHAGLELVIGLRDRARAASTQPIP